MLCGFVPSLAAEPVSFTREVAPILVRNCQACHGQREPKAEYQLLTFRNLLAPGESQSPPITPGKPGESYVYALLTATDDTRMPKDGDALLPQQIEIVKRWIEEGAKFDGADETVLLASIIPKLPNPDPPAAYRHPFPVTAVAFHPSGNELAAAGYHEVTIWNPVDGTLLRRIKNVPERVHGLAYSNDGNVLVVSGGQPGVVGEVKLFNPADGTLLKDLLTTSDVCFRVAINAAGNKLAVACSDRSIRIFDLATGNLDRSIESHADWVVSVAWSPDGSKIASASRDRLAKVFKADTGESIHAFGLHNEPVHAVAFLPGGNRVISGGADKRARHWKLDDGQQSGEAGFGGQVQDIITVGEKTFTAAADGNILQHRTENYAHTKTYNGYSDVIYAMAYHPATERLAAGCFNGEIRIMHAEAGNELIKFIAAPGYTPPVAPKP